MSEKEPYQLRWVLRSVPAPHRGEGVSEKVRILQYRVRDMQPLLHYYDDENNWSAWKDVPEVDL